MAKEITCSHCKKKDDLVATADIEYTDSEFSLLVSSKSVQKSKDTFNELFDKVKKFKTKIEKNSEYIN